MNSMKYQRCSDLTASREVNEVKFYLFDLLTLMFSPLGISSKTSVAP